jgi:Cu(I)/Ag(I) efflux system membrane fusion protein
MGGMLQAYYNMKDAFVKSDTILVNKEAQVFTEKIMKIETNNIKADAAIVELAGQLKQTLATETNHLIAAKELENKRKVFQVVSDQLFDLLRTIGYQGSKVYQQFCPMAFDNNGAAWLSSSSEIVNPYFGSKMLHCGEVRDSIYTAKQ